MRTALLSLVAALVTALAPVSALAQTAEPPIPERRLLVERDVDYYGADLQSIFDTSFEGCRAACLADGRCVAFTFNARSDSCFTKRGVERREPYSGAMSAVVLSLVTWPLVRLPWTIPARNRA